MKTISAEIVPASRPDPQRRARVDNKHGKGFTHAVRPKVWLHLCAALLGLIATAFSQSSPADGPWSGQIQCQLNVQQSGYTRVETQTWTLAATMPTGTNGDMQLYPATWTATGQGGLQKALGPRTALAQWNLSVPATPATIAMFVRAQDKQFVIRLWQRPIPAPNTLSGTRQFADNGVVQPGIINSSAKEWTLPWILADPRAQISGKFSIPTESLSADLTPTGAPLTPAVCVWEFSRSASSNAAGTTAAAATIVGSAGTGASVSGAGVPSAAAGGAPTGPGGVAGANGGAGVANNSGVIADEGPKEAGTGAGTVTVGATPVSTQTSGGTDLSASSFGAGAAIGSDVPLASTQTSGAVASGAASTATTATTHPLISVGSGGATYNIVNSSSTGSTVDLVSNLSITSTIPQTLQIASPHLVSGGTASLLFRVSNVGSAAADGAVVSVPAQPGVTIQAVACSLKKCPTPAELSKGWRVPQMAAGATETFTLDASVAAAKGPLTLMARSEALSGITDSNPANNSYTLNATVVPLAADLEVSVTNLDHSGSQTRLAYEVMVKNITGLAADGAVVISPVVAGVKKLAVLCVSNSASARNLLGGYAECPANPTVLQIEQGLAIPRLGAGSTITFRIDAIATISGNQTLSASATPPSGMSDPVVSNNSATAVVATIGETPGNADVSIVIVKRPPPGKNMVGFEVNVRNAGPDPASLTVIRVPAVAGTTVALENCAVPLYATTPVKAQCPFNLTVAGLATGLEIPWFPANSSLTFTIDLKLPTSSGTVTLSANATVPKGGTDPDPKNNSAHATATIP